MTIQAQKRIKSIDFDEKILVLRKLIRNQGEKFVKIVKQADPTKSDRVGKIPGKQLIMQLYHQDPKSMYLQFEKDDQY